MSHGMAKKTQENIALNFLKVFSIIAAEEEKKKVSIMKEQARYNC